MHAFSGGLVLPASGRPVPSLDACGRAGPPPLAGDRPERPDVLRPTALKSGWYGSRFEPDRVKGVRRLLSEGDGARPRSWTFPCPEQAPLCAVSRNADLSRAAGGSERPPRPRSPVRSGPSGVNPRPRSPAQTGASPRPRASKSAYDNRPPDDERTEWDAAPGAAPPDSPAPRGVGGAEPQSRFERVVDELVQVACSAKGPEGSTASGERLDAAFQISGGEPGGEILPSYALSKAVHILSHELGEPDRAEALIHAAERRGVAIRGAVLAPLVKLFVSRGQRARWEAMLNYYFEVRPPGDVPDDRLKSALAAGYAMYDEMELARAVLSPGFGWEDGHAPAEGEAGPSSSSRNRDAALCWAMLHAAANLLELALAARYGSADGAPGELEGAGTGEAAAAACARAIDAVCGRFEQNGQLWARLRPNMVRDWSRRTFDKRVRADLLEEALDVLLPGFSRLGRGDDLLITAVQAACGRGEAERAEAIAARLVADVARALPRGRRAEGDGDAVWEVALALASAHAREGGNPARARSLLVGLARASRSEADARVCTGFVDEALVQPGLGGPALAEIFRALARPPRAPVDPSTFALRWANRLLDDHPGLAARGRALAHRRRRLAAAADSIRGGAGGPSQALEFALAAEAALVEEFASGELGAEGGGEDGEGDVASLEARVAEVVRVVDECTPSIRQHKVGGLMRARSAALLLVYPSTPEIAKEVRALVGPIRPQQPRPQQGRGRRGRRKSKRGSKQEQEAPEPPPFELSGRRPVLDLLDSIRAYHARENAPAPFDRYKLLTKAASALGEAGLAGATVRLLAEAAALGLDELFAVASVPVLWSSAGDRTAAWSGVKAAETVYDERAGRLLQWRHGLGPPPPFLPAARPPSPEGEGGALGRGGFHSAGPPLAADDMDSKNLHFMYATTAFWLVRRCGAEGADAADALLGRALRRGARVEPWTVNALARAYRVLGRPDAAERVQSAYSHAFAAGNGGGNGGGGGGGGGSGGGGNGDRGAPRLFD
eukprot:tig00020572_g11556.t1